MLIIISALFTFTSCSSMVDPQESSSTKAGESNVPTDGRGKASHQISSWTDPGIIHNRAMTVLDDSLASFYPSRFSTEEDCPNPAIV